MSDEQPEVPEANAEMEAELANIDATEIISVIRRPGEDIDVDFAGIDSDAAVAMLVKALFYVVLDEIGYWDEEIPEDDDELDGE